MIVLTFLDFPDPDQAHRSSAIDDFFTAFVNVYPSHIFVMSMGIGYLLKLHENKSCKPTPPSIDVDGVSMLDDYCNYVATLPA
jgi:hypothetical protein